MSIAQPVYKWHTFVPVRFTRATSGAPSEERPDLDDRGHRDAEHGPVLGISVGDTVGVAVRRVAIDTSADLWITSTDAAVVSVEDPGNGHIGPGARVVIRVRGHRASGTTPSVRTAKLQARFGSSSGPVVGELMVWVFRVLTVDVTPHIVKIRGTGGEGTSVANVADIMAMVRGIWKPCGIAFNVGATRNEDVTYATAGVVSDAPYSNTTGFGNTELGRLLNTHSVPNSINAYFVRIIGSGNTLGYGFSRSSIATFHLTNPGIVLADTTAGGVTRDTQYWANDLAHEIGHFLTLQHAGNVQQPNELEDMWARRMLMHPFNRQGGHDPWPRSNSNGVAFANRPFSSENGYGTSNRGCMITMKDLPQIALDAECGLARNCASRSGGPY
jgi:hypothetical protein